MRINRNTASFLVSMLLLTAFLACSGSKGHDDPALDKPILVSTQCDAGATINPTSVRVNYGDRPTFNITLSSGTAIQTIYCNSGGSLVGTQFTMGSVQGADNVHVVTQNRWVGSSVQGELTESAKSIVMSASGTESIRAERYAVSELTATVNAEAGVKLMLRTELFGKSVTIPLSESAPGVYEARFILGAVAPVSVDETLPEVVQFDIIREGETEKNAHGALFIAVHK